MSFLCLAFVLASDKIERRPDPSYHPTLTRQFGVPSQTWPYQIWFFDDTQRQNDVPLLAKKGSEAKVKSRRRLTNQYLNKTAAGGCTNHQFLVSVAG